MSRGMIVITAKGADAKLVNRLLLYLRDWEFGEEGSWDAHRILRTIDEASTDQLPCDEPPVEDLGAGKLQAQNLWENKWEGLPVEEVEKIMLAKDDGHGSTSLFLLLDDKGWQDQTIIVAHRAMSPEEDVLWLPEYNKVRVPWYQTHSMWCNLDIANMDFEDFCDYKVGADENRWWKYKSVMGGEHYDEFTKQRDVAIKELEKLDMA